MVSIKLKPEQEEAIRKLHSGSVLWGGVGSGKTFTSLAFYKKKYKKSHLYVITTAKVRDGKDWEKSAETLGDIPNITVDSWNNIEKYLGKPGFFIFDEQKALGYGKWSKTMIKIAHSNPWIMLSATPGDNWMDYMALFIANGYYKNKTDFTSQHVIWDPFVSFPRIKGYVNEEVLFRHRKDILVHMKVARKTVRKRQYLYSDYNKRMYNNVIKNRLNPFTDKPIKNASEFTQVIRKIVSTSPGRIQLFMEQVQKHDKAIVFYNYEYEREIITRNLELANINFAEWNGKKHEDLPDSEKWVYVVQFSAAEGWNATTTNQVIFYSPNYSYKIIEQAEGRIDRLNTPFHELYYTYLLSKSGIDSSVIKAIQSKKVFNESYWKG